MGRPNARLNPPPDDITQTPAQVTSMMRRTLRAVGLNELLGGRRVGIILPARIYLSYYDLRHDIYR
jgi:hypothetical protein